MDAIDVELTTVTSPDPARRAVVIVAYPENCMRQGGSADDRPSSLRSFERLVAPGEYRTSFTRPAMFAVDLPEQLTLLMEDYDIEVEAVAGRQEIPFP